MTSSSRRGLPAWPVAVWLAALCCYLASGALATPDDCGYSLRCRVQRLVGETKEARGRLVDRMSVRLRAWRGAIEDVEWEDEWEHAVQRSKTALKGVRGSVKGAINALDQWLNVDHSEHDDQHAETTGDVPADSADGSQAGGAHAKDKDEEQGRNPLVPEWSDEAVIEGLSSPDICNIARVLGRVSQEQFTLRLAHQPVILEALTDNKAFVELSRKSNLLEKVLHNLFAKLTIFFGSTATLR